MARTGKGQERPAPQRTQGFGGSCSGLGLGAAPDVRTAVSGDRQSFGGRTPKSHLPCQHTLRRVQCVKTEGQRSGHWHRP